MSNFGTASLDLNEKVPKRRFFKELVPKLTEFWNKLKWRVIDVSQNV